jgi:hypothetical protein
MSTAISPVLSTAEQAVALASLSLHAVLTKRGITTIDCRKYLSISRAEMTAFFRQNPEKAEALQLKKKEKKPVHDCLCMESRSGRFVVYDMDHGKERWLYWYTELPEAATDFVAFHYGYGYPDGYGFKKEG